MSRRREILLVVIAPLLDSREVQGALTGEHARGTVGALNKTWINDQVRLERHRRLLKGFIYRGRSESQAGYER